VSSYGCSASTGIRRCPTTSSATLAPPSRYREAAEIGEKFRAIGFEPTGLACASFRLSRRRSEALGRVHVGSRIAEVDAL